jgi:hypothetical protein
MQVEMSLQYVIVFMKWSTKVLKTDSKNQQVRAPGPSSSFLPHIVVKEREITPMIPV